MKRGTLHKFCVEVLREFGSRVGVEQGFGIADDEYQYSVMWRLEANPRRHSKLLQLFTLHRLKGEELIEVNQRQLEKYLGMLKREQPARLPPAADKDGRPVDARGGRCRRGARTAAERLPFFSK